MNGDEVNDFVSSSSDIGIFAECVPGEGSLEAAANVDWVNVDTGESCVFDLLKFVLHFLAF